MTETKTEKNSGLLINEHEANSKEIGRHIINSKSSMFEMAIRYHVVLGIPAKVLIEIFESLGYENFSSKMSKKLSKAKLEDIDQDFEVSFAIVRKSLINKLIKLNLELLEAGLSKEKAEVVVREKIEKSEINISNSEIEELLQAKIAYYI